MENTNQLQFKVLGLCDRGHPLVQADVPLGQDLQRQVRLGVQGVQALLLQRGGLQTAALEYYHLTDHQTLQLSITHLCTIHTDLLHTLVQ